MSFTASDTTDDCPTIHRPIADQGPSLNQGPSLETPRLPSGKQPKGPFSAKRFLGDPGLNQSKANLACLSLLLPEFTAAHELHS